MEQTWYNNNPGWPEKATLIPLHSNISIHHQALVSSSPFILPWPQAIYGPISSPLAVTHNANVVHHLGEGEEEEEDEDPVLAAAASKSSHSQAEKQRRERINAHLSTLRRLIPHTHKMDKAALLGTVVDHVKELKRKVVEINKVSTIPSEFDEVTVVDCSGHGHENVEHPIILPTSSDNTNADEDGNMFWLKVSVCCQDRPEVLRDVIRALKGLKLRAVRADIVTVGGRVITILNLCPTSSSRSSKSVNLSSLKQSLKMVLSRVASSSLSSSNYLGLSRMRHRMLFPSQR